MPTPVRVWVEDFSINDVLRVTCPRYASILTDIRGSIVQPYSARVNTRERPEVAEARRLLFVGACPSSLSVARAARARKPSIPLLHVEH